MEHEIITPQIEDFYKNAANYWSEVPATVDGMLGGFGHISEIDIRSSKALLKQLLNSKDPPDRKYALDCGAGIGRITRFLLTDLFEKVDMVEQNAIFLEKAKSYLGTRILETKIGEMYSVGLQSFKPEDNKYDVIWVQWVLGHLTDEDLVNFLKSCRRGLKSNGVIVVKENVTTSEIVDIDDNDSSVTRPMFLLKSLFEKANYDCIRLVKQHNFPKGIYTVYMFILKPKKSGDESNRINFSNISNGTPEQI